MSKVDRSKFVPAPGMVRSHENMKANYGVMRPGKTRTDKANGSWEPKGVKARRVQAAHDAIKTR